MRSTIQDAERFKHALGAYLVPDDHERHSGLPLFPPDWTIIEIKVNERILYWLTELVATHNLNLVRVSKYCRSIELAQNLPIPSCVLRQ